MIQVVHLGRDIGLTSREGLSGNFRKPRLTLLRSEAKGEMGAWLGYWRFLGPWGTSGWAAWSRPTLAELWWAEVEAEVDAELTQHKLLKKLGLIFL